MRSSARDEHLKIHLFQQSLPFEDSISIFKKPFEQRSDQEHQDVVSLFRKIPQSQFISGGPLEYLKSLSKLFQYQFLPQGQAICHYGDTLETFWIILDGDVRKYVPYHSNEWAEQKIIHLISTKQAEARSITNPQESQVLVEGSSVNNSSPKSNQNILKGKGSPTRLNPGKSIDKESKNKSLTFESLEEAEIFRNFNMPDKYFISEDTPSVKMDGMLGPGDSLPKVMWNFKKTCPSTLVAWSDVHIISAPIEDFLMESEKIAKVIQDNLVFLQRVFPELTRKTLLSLLPRLQTKAFRIGECIFNEESECSELYIVQKGEVELSKSLAQADNKDTQEERSNLKITTKPYKARIMLIPEAQLIGEEVVLNADKMIFSAKAKTSETVCYFVSKDELRSLDKTHPEIVWAIRNKARLWLNSKLVRIYENHSEAEVTQQLLQEPTITEKMEKLRIKQQLDLSTRELLDKKLTKSEGILTHIELRNQENFQMTQEKLQKLVSTKTKIFREITKADPRVEAEESYPVLDTYSKEYGQSYYSHKAKEFSPRNQEEKGESLSVWKEAMGNGWYKKRLEVFQRTLQNMSGGQEYVSQRSKGSVINRMFMKSGRVGMSPEGERSTEHGSEDMNASGEQKDEQKLVATHPINISIMKTKLNQESPTPSLDMMQSKSKIKLENIIDEIKKNENVGPRYEKKLKKGLGFPKGPKSRFVGKSWKLDPEDETSNQMKTGGARKAKEELVKQEEQNQLTKMKQHNKSQSTIDQASLKHRRQVKKDKDKDKDIKLKTEGSDNESEKGVEKFSPTYHITSFRSPNRSYIPKPKRHTENSGENPNSGGNKKDPKPGKNFGGENKDNKVTLPQLPERLKIHKTEHHLFRPIAPPLKLIEVHSAKDLFKAFC